MLQHCLTPPTWRASVMCVRACWLWVQHVWCVSEHIWVSDWVREREREREKERERERKYANSIQGCVCVHVCECVCVFDNWALKLIAQSCNVFIMWAFELRPPSPSQQHFVWDKTIYVDSTWAGNYMTCLNASVQVHLDPKQSKARMGPYT